MHPPVAGRAREIPLVGAQRDRPHVAARGLGGREVPVKCPFAGVVWGGAPDFDLAAEADAGGYRAEAASRGADVVAAEFVG